MTCLSPSMLMYSTTTCSPSLVFYHNGSKYLQSRTDIWYGVYVRSNIALLLVCINIPSTQAFIRDVRSRGRQAGKRRPTRCCHRGLPEAGGLHRSIRRSRWHGSFQPKCRFSKKKQEKEMPAELFSTTAHAPSCFIA